MSAQLLRKLTIKGCNLSMKALKDAVAGIEDGANVPALKIVGKSTSAAHGSTDKGPYIKFGGDFYAVNLLTGERFQSGVCILPQFVALQLEAALKASNSVEFGLEIGVKRNDSSVTGYEFNIKPLIEAKPTDTVTALLSRAGIALPAPAAEAPAPAPAAPAAEAPAPAPAAPAAEAPAADKGRGKSKQTQG
jgi:hypothetical protein